MPSEWRCDLASHRNDPTPPFRRVDALVLGELEAPRDRSARVAGIDDVVDETPTGNFVDIDSRRNFADELLPGLVRRLFVAEELAPENADHPLGPHDADLRRRPGDDEVGLEGSAAHDVVTGSVGLAYDDRHLRHGRRAHDVQHFRAVADDALGFDL